MKIFEKYFVPYVEYSLRTTLSEEELKAAFEKEFPPVFSFAAFQAGFGTDKFSFTRGSKPFHLHPGTTGRNSFRGEIVIKCQKAEYSTDTILHITIAPQNMSLFCWIYVGFAMLMGILLLCAGKLQAVVPLVMIAFMFLILHLCRSAAENEIPEISKAFEQALRTIEEKYRYGIISDSQHQTAKPKINYLSIVLLLILPIVLVWVFDSPTCEIC